MYPGDPRTYALLALVPAAASMFYYPNPQVSLLEHILVDNWGAYASNFSAAITPCTNYVTETGNASLVSGRTTAAQWMRVSFHDFVTANVTAGTGGIDASIGFETGRAENVGSAFNDSFTFWQPFVNEYVSMADLVALGTVMSVNLCGGKYIPYRPGRIDALAADPTTGVPEPQSDLNETLAEFARAGFNREDSIGLTACGHTMGSVHHGGFPDVSPASAVTADNTNGGVNFDSTRGAFDSLVVSEYIDGTGQMGGPLVTSFNETVRSDLRLYESDGNKTMRNLYNKGPGYFQEVCVELMGRMINTVPEAVELQGPIQPLAVKPINVTWDFDADDQLVLSGKIRVLKPAQVPASAIAITVGGQKLQLHPESSTGSTVFESSGINDTATYGVTYYYSFSVAGANLTDASSFAVTAGRQAEGEFPISWGSFVVPSLTTTDGQVVNFTVAVPETEQDPISSGLEVTVTSPVLQPLTLAPKIVKGTGTFAAEATGTKDGLTLWSGSYDVGQAVTGAITVTLSREGQVLDTLLLGAGVAGW
ncbi:heme peroxidase [Xylariales sp. PMI_506]|nr:heme peroxidase [Xylariales sp. PMI_506]